MIKVSEETIAEILKRYQAGETGLGNVVIASIASCLFCARG